MVQYYASVLVGFTIHIGWTYVISCNRRALTRWKRQSLEFIIVNVWCLSIFAWLWMVRRGVHFVGLSRVLFLLISDAACSTESSDRNRKRVLTPVGNSPKMCLWVSMIGECVRADATEVWAPFAPQQWLGHLENRFLDMDWTIESDKLAHNRNAPCCDPIGRNPL